MNDLYAQEWSQFTNHFRPTFKLLKRDKHGSRTVRIYAQHNAAGALNPDSA
jgi:hypothetical protein